MTKREVSEYEAEHWKSAGLTLKDHLAKLSKGELVELVAGLSKEHAGVERKLAIRFVEAGSGEAIKQYKALMRKSINRTRIGMDSFPIGT